MTKLQQELQTIFVKRDRANMQKTIDELLNVLTKHPNNPEVLYEVGVLMIQTGKNW